MICAVDRGMVRGMLSALYGDGDDVAVATEAQQGPRRHDLRHRGLTVSANSLLWRTISVRLSQELAKRTLGAAVTGARRRTR